MLLYHGHVVKRKGEENNARSICDGLTRSSADTATCDQNACTRDPSMERMGICTGHRADVDDVRSSSDAVTCSQNAGIRGDAKSK
jgi:hypothetical protein